MKGAFLVQHTLKQYSKDHKGSWPSYIARYQLGYIQLAEAFGWPGETITISSYDYVRGYVTTQRQIALWPCVWVFVEGGSILLNKQSRESTDIPYQIDVYQNYIVFKNDVIIGAYYSAGIDERLRPGDKLLIFYPTGNIGNVTTRTIQITDERYDAGYVTLPVSNVIAMYPYVYRGPHMLPTEYDVIDNNFVFRNGVTIGDYTSSGINEVLQPGDIVSILIQMR